MNNEEIAAALFRALAGGDASAVRQLCASDLRATQNQGPVMGVEALIDFSTAVLGVVSDFRYEQAVRVATAAGFVEEHRVRGTLPDGSQLDLPACVVGEVSGGRVVALREYLDSRAAAGLLEALAAG